jgi:CRP/FNR family transcriptional regulator, dissimilatory nitrate respiration regulator
MLNSIAEFKQWAIASTLRHCPLFTGFSSARLDAIASATTMKTLAKGEYLFCEGTPVFGFFVVKTGAIKLHRVNLKGQEQVIQIVRPNESFAEESLLAASGYPANARALAPSRLLVVHKAEFVDLLKHDHELVLRLLRSVGNHVQGLVGLVDDLTLKDVKARLAQWLLHHCPDPDSREPQRIQLPLTKRVLALELGTTSETLSRTLTKLRALELISVEARAVTLLCPIRLAELLSQFP